MVTLHAYILRELLKTFALTLVALTGLLTMGGGLFNAVTYEGISATDVVRFTPYMVPIAITIAMPMAALFAATMVYGRLAADNELTACRAAGVNVHRLFLSSILLGAFVAASTLVLANVIIPDCAVRIENFARNNIRDLIVQHLENRGFFHYQKGASDSYTLTTERVQGELPDALLAKKGFETGPRIQYVLLTNPTFMQADGGGKLLRFSCARYALCCFDTRVTPAELTFFLRDGRDFRVGEGDTAIDEQQFGPIAAPQASMSRLSSADLGQLLHWQAAPWDAPKQRDEIQRFLAELACQRFYDYCSARVGGKEFVLDDDDGRQYRVRCAAVSPERRAPTFERAEVLVHDAQQNLRTRYEAPRLKLSAAPLPSGRILVELRLIRTPEQDVLEYDVHAGNLGEPRRKSVLSLDRLRIPPEVLEDVARFTPAQVIDPAAPLPVTGPLVDKRVSLQNSVRRLQRQIPATIHQRMGYTSSALVTVLMGATLGVMFRGSRALAAFALALVPFSSVLILIVIGQKLTVDERLAAYGPLITWGGLLLALLADGVLIRAGVRR